ncbi:MAG: sensor histidine kinase, partial [Lachnospiraceae bacterium]|nr:sensor histidine kinase [Lachnospiraceae bacterium]
ALLMTAAISTVNRDENIKPNIEALKNTLNDTMDSVRASVHDLHDESIDLEANIRLLMRDFTFCEVRLDYTGAAGMSREDKYCMLAVVKEALSNIAKHSNASFARITVRSHESMHQLMIEDNGNVSINSDGKGIGLENIENRVKELGGTVYFSDANGFRILITLPVA